MMFLLSLFYAALAVWSILTSIGLVRLRSWARYSVLVIAGCVAFFGAIATLMSIAMPFLMRNVVPAVQPIPGAGQPDASAAALANAPHLVHGVFLFMGAFYGIFTVVAIALLVYYNLAKTRALFLQNAPVNLSPPNTSTGRPRPIAIAILSWFFLISAPFTLIYAFLPFPAFLFGFTVYGFAAHCIYVVFTCITFAVGYGLYRLRPEARVGFIAWIAFGLLNMLAVLTPWGSRSFQAYMEKFTLHISTAPTPNPFATHGVILFTFAFAAAINLFFLWLLHRHRAAFTPAPPPPPAPVYDAPFAG